MPALATKPKWIRRCPQTSVAMALVWLSMFYTKVEYEGSGDRCEAA
jgi:hypothetical protein